MIDRTSCLHVSKNDETPGGTTFAISAIRSSSIGPGPLGISDTNPIADAPFSIASHASATLAIQHIFTRGLRVGFIALQVPENVRRTLVCRVVPNMNEYCKRPWLSR